MYPSSHLPLHNQLLRMCSHLFVPCHISLWLGQIQTREREELGKVHRPSLSFFLSPPPPSSHNLHPLQVAHRYVITLSLDRLTTIEVSFHELIAWVHARLFFLGFWPSRSRKFIASGCELLPSDRGNGSPLRSSAHYCFPMGDTNQSSLLTSSSHYRWALLVPFVDHSIQHSADSVRYYYSADRQLERFH